MKYPFLLLLLIFIVSCTNSNQEQIDKAKKEIVTTEQNFEKMAKEKGIAEAFFFYADDSAVISRNSRLIMGKDSVKAYYQGWTDKNIQLLWKPDYVEVSSSCDLGYTYGKYTHITTDAYGNQVSSSGYFHTVWKKQKNGDWKFVWD
jgi:ketosteroid isomerase-like protein